MLKQSAGWSDVSQSTEDSNVLTIIGWIGIQIGTDIPDHHMMNSIDLQTFPVAPQGGQSFLLSSTTYGRNTHGYQRMCLNDFNDPLTFPPAS